MFKAFFVSLLLGASFTIAGSGDVDEACDHRGKRLTVSRPFLPADGGLPYPLWVHILGYLDQPETRLNAKLTCKTWHKASWESVSFILFKSKMDPDALVVSAFSELPNIKMFSVDYFFCRGYSKPKAIQGFFGFLPKLAGVKYLYLPGENLPFGALEVLLHHMPQGLESLNLDKVGLTGEDMVRLAPAFPKSLQSIGLSLNPIGESGATALAKAIGLNLIQLFLNGCEIGAKGGEALAAGLKKCVKLNILNLYGTGLQMSGAKAVLQNVPASLRSLTFSRSDMGPSTANAMSNLPSGIKIFCLP